MPVDTTVLSNEEGLLGSILLDPAHGMRVIEEESITAQHFADQHCQIVFSGIQAVMAKRGAVDGMLLQGHLEATGELADLGGGAYLEGLAAETVTASSVRQYAEAVKEAARDRKTTELLANAAEDVQAGVKSGDEIRAKLAAALSFLIPPPRNRPLRIGDLKAEKIQEWKAAQSQGFVGMPSCFRELNHILGGWRPGVLGIVGGYRGEGKSTYVRQEALFLARRGDHVGLFSLEDPDSTAAASMVGNYADVDVFLLDTGRAGAEEINTMSAEWDKLADLPLDIVGASLPMQAIESLARELHARDPLHILFLDHIQLIAPYRLPSMSRNDTVASYSQRLAALSKELRIPIVAVSQLSRSSEKEDRPPRLSDLRDSGALEQDARQVVLLYRQDDHHVLKVAKNNFGRSGLDVKVRRIDGRQRFELETFPRGEGWNQAKERQA